MSEDVTKLFVLPKFNPPPVPVTWREFLYNDTTKRDKTPLKVLGLTRDESGGVYMIRKTVMQYKVLR